MHHDDLAPFAVADGLLARIAAERPGASRAPPAVPGRSCPNDARARADHRPAAR